MGRYSLRSIILGVGIGMVLTSSFNILFNNDTKDSVVALGLRNEIDEGSMRNDVVKQIEQIKNGLGVVQNQESQDQHEDMQREEEVFLATIKPGMTTKEIAEYLFENGVILNIDEFIGKASELQITRSLKYGSIEIPSGKSIEEVLFILKEQ